jgi:CYTH domain-containing protein
MEIERKYKVKNLDFINLSYQVLDIKQGFLNSDPNRTVRIRLNNEHGFITVKGKSSSDGLERFEWEKQISHNEAIQLLNLCETGIIDKKRYLVNFQSQIFEVDVFYGENEGLIIAEIELPTKETLPELPDWIGEEVTGDIKYYNSNLSKKPFLKW